MSSNAADALANALHDPDALQTVYTGTISAIYADGTVDVDLGGNRLCTGAIVLSFYSPATGDAVEVMRRDPHSWLVLGSVRTSNATTVGVANNWSLPYNVGAAPVAPGPSAPNPFVVNAASTYSYRKIDGWSRTAVYQGAYTSSQGSSLGYWSGCYFYGSSAFSAIYGQTCTSLSITLERESAGGNAGAVPLYIAPHVHGSHPSGAPTWWAGAIYVGSLAWGQHNTFALPKSWGQAILDGHIKGFGHRYSGSAAYSIGDAVGTYASAGHLSLGWS